MKEHITHIDLEGEILIDIDLARDESYIGITDKGNVILPFTTVFIPQSFRHPIIRWIDDGQFLIVDARVSARVNNCFIYDLDGKVHSQFFVGDGVQDVEIVKEKIIVTYFDEGVFGMEGPNNEGLVVFDNAGQILFRYNEKHQEAIIADCYCICSHGSNKILFYPYTEFPLIELDLDSWEETSYKVPEGLEGSNSITYTQDSLIFHSPYYDKKGVFKWVMGETSAERIGEYEEGLRGLKDGRFLFIGERAFTILDFN